MTDLEKRVLALEDVHAIKELRHAYFRACDNTDIEALRRCFLPEAEIGIYGWGVFPSFDAFIAKYIEEDTKPGLFDMHFGQNPKVIIDGDTASGVWDLYYSTLRPADRSYLLVAGYYEDEYVRTADGWRISKSHLHERFEMEMEAGVDGAARFTVLAHR